MIANNKTTVRIAAMVLAVCVTGTISTRSSVAETPSGLNDEGIQQRLKTPIEIDFNESPLSEVIDDLSRRAKLAIHLDPQGLAEEGVSSDTPVTIDLSQPISCKSALNLILQPLRLNYVIQHGVVLVTSEALRAGEHYAVTYNVADLLEDELATIDDLMEVVMHIEPRSWLASGGLGFGEIQADAISQTFFVRHKQDVHEQVVDILQQLRRLSDRRNRAQRPAAGRAAEEARAARPPVSSDDLTRTSVHAVLSSEISPDQNHLYCATLPLIWRKLQSLVGGPVQLTNNPDLADRMNAAADSPLKLSDDAYVAAVGRMQDGVWEQIAAELKEKFPRRAPPEWAGFPPDVLLGYAYLYKRLPFARDFEPIKKPLPFRSGGSAAVEKVKSFGIRSVNYSVRPDDLIAGQVRVLNYRSDDDFVIELLTKSTQDQIVLAKMRPAGTLESTIQEVERRIRLPHDDEWNAIGLREGESLIIPIIDLHVSHSRAEFFGELLNNPGWQGTPFGSLTQQVRFRLDEHGAELEAQEELLGISFAPPPRHFVFDRPFLIYLRHAVPSEEDNGETEEWPDHRDSPAAPYFALWVDNAEVLEKADEKPPVPNDGTQ